MPPLRSEPLTNTPLETTIVISCYNHRAYVEGALRSVANQSRRPSQLIVTDDASTDGSQQIIRRWLDSHWPDAVFIANESNIGFPAILNKAMACVVGDLVAVMSADDWMHEDRVRLQAEAFESADEDTGMVWAEAVAADETGSPMIEANSGHGAAPASREGNLFLQLLGPTFISTTSVMMRTSALKRVGPYDETLVAEDYDMFLRLSRFYRWAYVPLPLVYYRVLPTSMSGSSRFATRRLPDRIRILRKHLGFSPEADEKILSSVSKWTVHLYSEGRSSRDTAKDIWFCTRRRPTAAGCVILMLSIVGVPGRTVFTARRLARRCLARLPLRRAAIVDDISSAYPPVERVDCD